jgi:hypothetical protein
MDSLLLGMMRAALHWYQAVAAGPALLQALQQSCCCVGTGGVQLCLLLWHMLLR